MTRAADRLRSAVERAVPRLRAVEDPCSALREGGWTRKEILGHLIDSASNNHGRFVRAAARDDLVFDGYDQDAWASLQGYADAPWEELVELWRTFNLHIARVMDALPEEARLRERREHSLDAIAWAPVPAGPVTLEWFLEDYVGHVEHHLEQLFAGGSD